VPQSPRIQRCLWHQAWLVEKEYIQMFFSECFGRLSVTLTFGPVTFNIPKLLFVHIWSPHDLDLLTSKSN